MRHPVTFVEEYIPFPVIGESGAETGAGTGAGAVDGAGAEINSTVPLIDCSPLETLGR